MISNKNIVDVFLDLDKPIYICGHKNPDQDSLGSCIALCLFLRKLNKKAYVLLKKEDEKECNIIKFDFFVDKIEKTDYVFVAMDLNEISRLGDYGKDYLKAKIKINIDHHIKNSTNADYILSNDKESSTCEMVYKIITKFDKKLLTRDMAKVLYAGIYTDTNCLSRRLTNRTLSIIQSLIRNKIDYETINKKTLLRRSLEEVKLTGILAGKIENKNNFCVVKLDKKDTPLTLNSLTKKVAEDLRKIEDLPSTNLLFLVVIDDKITGKIMTQNGSAEGLCSLLGGGGHKNEAGFTTNKTYEEIIKIAENYYK